MLVLGFFFVCVGNLQDLNRQEEQQNNKSCAFSLCLKNVRLSWLVLGLSERRRESMTCCALLHSEHTPLIKHSLTHAHTELCQCFYSNSREAQKL